MKELNSELNTASLAQNESFYDLFDLNEAKKYAEAFALSTGVGCTVSDIAGNVVYDVGGNCHNCSLCAFFDSLTGGAPCRDSYIYSMEQSEKLGGKYIYFCRLGLTCFASPIIADGQSVALLTAGPILMVEPDDFLEYDLNYTETVPEHQRPLLSKVVHGLTYKPPSVVSRLSSLLFIACAYISGVSGAANKLAENEISQAVQNKIGEFLQEAKGRVSDIGNSYPFEKEYDLRNAILNSDKALAGKLLNELLGHIFFASGSNFEVIKTRSYELIVLISRASIAGGADHSIIFALNQKYLNQLNSVKTIDELCMLLTGIMNRFTDYVFDLGEVKHADVMTKALEYIRKNYYAKITLEEVASYVFLSPSYFSKLFKDEIKCNFNTYLNRIRIENSKKLLLSGKLSLVEIAGMVGFEDQSYFSKVFKTFTGVPPGKFQRSRDIKLT